MGWAGTAWPGLLGLSWMLSLRTSGFCSGRPRELVLPGGQLHPSVCFCAGLFLPLHLPFCSLEGLGYSRSHYVATPAPYPRFRSPWARLNSFDANLCPPPPFSFIHSTSTYPPTYLSQVLVQILGTGEAEKVPAPTAYSPV